MNTPPTEVSPLNNSGEQILKPLPERSVSRGCFLTFVALISCLGILAGIIMLVAQIVYIYFFDESCNLFILIFSISYILTVVQFLIRCYIIVFSVTVLLTEMDWTAAVRNSVVSISWTFRGFFYMFIGLLELALDNDVDDWKVEVIPFSIILSGSSMLIVGVLYLLMGVCCLKKTRDDRMARYIQLMSYLQVNI